jgi:flagellar biosynthetic protein FliQ
MGIDEFLKLGFVSIQVAALVSAPVLIFGLVAGLSVSIFQAATQINDAALAFIPKIAAAVVALLFFGHFMISKIAGFTVWCYTQIGSVTQ